MSLSVEDYLNRLKKITWSNVPEYIQEAWDQGYDPVKLSQGLATEKKQVIEVLTTVLGKTKSPEAIMNIVKMMFDQKDTANAQRGRNALLQIGVQGLPVIRKYLTEASGSNLFYFIQIIGVTKSSSFIDDLKKIASESRAARVKEIANQAIAYIEGKKDLSECDLLPSMDQTTDKDEIIRDKREHEEKFNVEISSKSDGPSTREIKKVKSQFRNKLECVYCGHRNKALSWPINGDIVPFYQEEVRGDFPVQISVTCDHCNREWFVTWESDPGTVI